MLRYWKYILLPDCMKVAYENVEFYHSTLTARRCHQNKTELKHYNVTRTGKIMGMSPG